MAQRCLDAGMDDYIAKPVHVEDLQRTLNKWLPKDINDETGKGNLPMNTPEYSAHIATTSSEDSVDRTMLTRMIGDDPVSHQRLLQSFLRFTPDILAGIKHAFSERNANEIKAQAHKLKSSARSMGANHLADTCEAIETFARELQWAEIEPLVSGLDGLYEAVELYVEENFS